MPDAPPKTQAPPRGLLDIRQASTQADLDHCLRLRVAVFVEEQGVSPDEEIDDLDTLSSRAIHYIAFGDGTPIATARLVIDGVHAKIGRVAVARASRGQGYGASIMRAVMTDAAKRGIRDLTLHSQTHAIAFYQHLGFVAYGDGFLEAGIPHIAMRLATRSKGPSI